MKNRDIFLRDPVKEEIPNKGVATVSEATSDVELSTLNYELRNFVCEGQYAVGLRRILNSFLGSLANGSPQKGVWVSGFYGSGKSHLVKVLRFLWTDYKLPNGVTARGLVSSMPSEVSELLKELDTAGKRLGGLHAAAGKVGDKTKSKDDIPLAVLQVVLQSLRLPDEYPAAQLYFYLHEKGSLDVVKTEIESGGSSISAELKNLWVSGKLRDALKKHCADFADINASEMPLILKAQFPPTDGKISVAQMVEAMHTALKLNGEMPLTLLALDELQQFIGDSAERSYAVQEIVEACANKFDSRLLIVATGQSAITETPNLQRLAGRFPEQIGLTNADVDTVTRTIVLGKKADSKDAIQKVIEDNKGEIFRHLKGSAIAPKASDSEVLVADYPILPVRRRFWERVLRAADPTGTSTMLRTQLRLIDEAVRSVANDELGKVVAADFLFNQEKGGLQQSGVLLKDELETIEKQTKNDSPNGELKSRLCALCFLIGKLPKDGAGDIGVKATPEILADLLVEDLQNDGAELRRVVPDLLTELESVNDLMFVDGEYRIQTQAGSEWANEFETRRRKIAADRSKVAELRAKFTASALATEVNGVVVTQGAVKEPRKTFLHSGMDKPKPDSAKIPIWVRDGWSLTVNDVVDDAARAGQEDSTVYVFIPSAGDELNAAIIAYEAAQETLATKGIPTTAEGQQARAAIDGRRGVQEQEIKRLVSAALSSANVFLGGGSEVDAGDGLRSKLQSACDTAATRMFPRFGIADDSKWSLVFQHARGGSGDPLKAIGYEGSAADNNVCKPILEFIGSGKRGTDVRRKFEGEGYGWPRDAIHGALLALLAGGAVLALRQGKAVKATELDGSTIGDAEFRVENVTVSTAQKLAIRKMYLEVGINCKPGEEVNQASRFIQTCLDIARGAGGEAPRPERPSGQLFLQIADLHGNEQLQAIHENSDQIGRDVEDWKSIGGKIDERLPSWNVLKQLLALATSLEGYAVFKSQVDAIETGRQLVQDPNPIAPLIDSIASELRETVLELGKKSIDCFENEMEGLKSSQAWNDLEDEQWRAIFSEVSIREVVLPDVSDTKKLIEHLEYKPVKQWSLELEAMPSRFAHAATKAGQLLEPTSIIFTAPRKLLRSKEEVESYIDELRSELLEKVEHSPVQVS